jgi:ABC-type nickel/cobalt efflux system permease component RcnA
VSFEVLFEPLEAVDGWLADLLVGAPLLVSLGIAFVLGLRHASDPDHLVAVTSLVASEDGDVRGAARLGAWWGVGHAATLLAVGLPLIALKSQLPAWLERGAEAGIGIVILLLAARVLVKWHRGDFTAGPHAHGAASDAGAHHHAADDHRHLRRGAGREHRHRDLRTPRQALAIGTLHGLAGTGAVVLLLVAALPDRLEAAAALAVFAPMSVLSMAALTSAFAWVLTRPLVEPLYRRLLIPVLGGFGLLFGVWYAGFT